MSRLSGEPHTGRRAVVVGSITPEGNSLAVRCAWCEGWQSDTDRIAHEKGAPISHGICPPCKAKMLAPFGGDAA